jgi:hypothetical protein
MSARRFPETSRQRLDISATRRCQALLASTFQGSLEARVARAASQIKIPIRVDRASGFGIKKVSVPCETV